MCRLTSRLMVVAVLWTSGACREPVDDRPAAGEPAIHRLASGEGWAVASDQDAQFVFIYDFDRNLARIDTRSREVATMTSHGGMTESNFRSVAVSPDGQWLAYIWGPEGEEPELRVLPAGGGEERTVVRGMLTPQLAWLPDNERLLTRLPDGLSVIGIADGAVRVVVPDSMLSGTYIEPRVSMDGAYVAFESDGTVYVADLAGGRPRPLAPSLGRAVAPLWAPDGNHIVYAAPRSGRWDLWAVPVEGGAAVGAPMLVAEDVGQIRSLALSRDGRFVHVQLGNTADIYCSGLEPVSRKLVGEPERVLTERGPPNRAGAWSPDGTLFAYLTRRPLPGAPEASVWRPALTDTESGDEHVFRLEASAPRRFYVRPEWSRDASHLYFNFADGVYTLDLATADHGYLVGPAGGGGGYAFLGIDPESGSILYAVASEEVTADDASSYQPRSRLAVVRRDPRTGIDEELWAGVGHWSAWAASLSPDGRSVALVEDLSLTGPSDEHLGSLSILDLDAGRLREVLREPWFWSSYVWDVDGARVILAGYRMREASTVVRSDGLTPNQETIFRLLDLDSGQLQHLGTISAAAGQEGYGARQMSLHPSGSPICYSVGGSIEDIVVREGVRIPASSR